MNRIYLDNAGTTRVREDVLETMSSFFSANYNAKQAQAVMANARERIRECLNADGYDVFFTSSGSEANNIALNCMAEQVRAQGDAKRVIYTPIEHASVYKMLSGGVFHDFEHIQLPVDCCGIPIVASVSALKDIENKGGMASTMYVNNEIGTVLPVRELVHRFHAEGMLTHVDAVQALGHIKLSLNALNADFPKGLGILMVKQAAASSVRTYLECRTDNLPYIMGFVTALETRYRSMDAHCRHMDSLKAHMVQGLKQIHPDVRIVGNEAVDRSASVSAILNVNLPFVEGDSVVVHCDINGIAVSSGSACSSGATQASHVIKALGFSEDDAKRCFRISVSDFTTIEEADRMLKVIDNMLKPFVEREKDVR
jgi:cysteine desulfurase